MSPVPRVRGLEARDAASGRWLCVDGGSAAPWRDVLIFGGRRLEHATDGAVPALWHRVRREAGRPRTVALFEQKYAEFYPLPVGTTDTPRQSDVLWAALAKGGDKDNHT